MLIENLDKYLNKNYYPFHMPGHKRNDSLLNKNLPYKRDITEIANFDNLNDPKDIFVSMENNLANIYKVKDAIISTNGSTSGILASIRSLCKKHKKILISRSSHKSVYNSIEIFNLECDFIDLKIDSNGLIVDIDYNDLINKLNNNLYDCILVTSPSYEGYIIDLKKVHKICKKYNTFLIVDMAHGSHIHLYENYEKFFSYDLAITSFHKNLSALTPAACVLIENNNIDIKEVRRNMAIFQTSSPSYIISQSIDDMIHSYSKFNYLKINLDEYLENFYKIKLKKLKLIDCERKDRTKILISTEHSNITGYDLQKLLSNYKIESEMAEANFLLLISTIFDKKEAFDYLREVLIKIDETLKYLDKNLKLKYDIPQKYMSISNAISFSKKSICLDNAVDKICGQYVYSYPPGIPIIVPGEIISKDIINKIKYSLTLGANLSLNNDEIFVIN